MANKTPVTNSYVDRINPLASTHRLLTHVRENDGVTWSLESYRIGGGQEKIPERRFRYLRCEARNPQLYKEEIEFLTVLSGITLKDIFQLPDIRDIDYRDCVKGLTEVVGEERIKDIRKDPDIKDPKRWIKAEYLLNLTNRCLAKFPQKGAA